MKKERDITGVSLAEADLSRGRKWELTFLHLNRTFDLLNGVAGFRSRLKSASVSEEGQRRRRSSESLA